MSFAVSVVLPSHNPRGDFLDLVLDALRNQTLSTSQWELIVVDNHSNQPLADLLNLTWHPSATILREDQLGLTRARLAGFEREDRDERWEAEQRHQARECHNLRDCQATVQVQQRGM